MIEHFEDRENGGFFFTADDHERLIHRPKPMMDDALPSGNGVAAAVLGRLGHLLGDTRYLGAAERVLRAARDGLERFPHAHTALLVALEEYIDPPEIVVIRAGPGELEQWRARATAGYAPRRVVVAIPDAIAGLPALLAERAPRGSAWRTCAKGTYAMRRSPDSMRSTRSSRQRRSHREPRCPRRRPCHRPGRPIRTCDDSCILTGGPAGDSRRRTAPGDLPERHALNRIADAVPIGRSCPATAPGPAGSE